VLVLAHRGANRRAPENTLAAFSAARALGADGVELDVRLSADGVAVVRHDAATPAGAVAGLSFAALRGADPALPTLAEALDACAGLLVNVEIKNQPGEPDWDPTERAAEVVVAQLAARGVADDVLVSSFSLATVDRVLALASAVPTALLTVGVDPLAALASAESHGHRALNPHVASLAGPVAGALTARAHELGVRVFAWTVNDPEDVRRLATAGVDGVITDVPEVAVAAR